MGSKRTRNQAKKRVTVHPMILNAISHAAHATRRVDGEQPSESKSDAASQEAAQAASHVTPRQPAAWVPTVPFWIGALAVLIYAALCVLTATIAPAWLRTPLVQYWQLPVIGVALLSATINARPIVRLGFALFVITCELAPYGYLGMELGTLKSQAAISAKGISVATFIYLLLLCACWLWSVAAVPLWYRLGLDALWAKCGDAMEPVRVARGKLAKWLAFPFKWTGQKIAGAATRAFLMAHGSRPKGR